MPGIPRVAFFTDTFHEINGVALTSRQFTAFAHRRGHPFLCVRGAGEHGEYSEGSVRHLELRRGPLAFALDRGLLQAPMLWRQSGRIARALDEFRPDTIHVVSPGDVSLIGVRLAKRMKIPLAISWHTNLHEFGAMRLERILSRAPAALRARVRRVSEERILNLVIAFYRLGDVLYAPNRELVEMLRARTGKPVFPMKRGIDTGLFKPARRRLSDGILRLGYVGRITPEKGVRYLRELEIALCAAGVPPFRFVVVGDGSERRWLEQNLAAADIPGILRGEELADAYADMDVFVFPSKTDTFGNVILEAFASGVPAVVTDLGGPKFIVDHGVSGFTATNGPEFVEYTARLIRDSSLRARMSAAAREQARGESWDTVFEKAYDGYASVRTANSATQTAPV